MIENLCYMLVYYMESLIFFLYFARNYEKKFKTSTIILIGLGIFNINALLFIVWNNEILNIISLLLTIVMYSKICYSISLKDSAIHTLLLGVAMLLTESMTFFIVGVIMGVPQDTQKNNFTVYIIMVAMSKVLYFVASILLSRGFKTKKSVNSKSKSFIPLFTFPALIMAIFTVFIYISFDYSLTNAYQISIFVICILSLFACVFIFIYYQLLLENEARINELESETKLNKVNETYLNILEHQNNEFQMMFHDTKNHYLTLKRLDNIEEVQEYIDKLYPEFESLNHIRISNNKIIDLILNKYIILCKNNGIKFSYEVKTANLEYIDNVELSIILNNALDNAVESAKESEEKIIELSLRRINNMDLLNIINSCNNSPILQGGHLITTKKQSKNHGFGSKIIERHTKSNDGEYEWFYDENEKRFHLSLLFKSK